MSGCPAAVALILLIALIPNAHAEQEDGASAGAAAAERLVAELGRLQSLDAAFEQVVVDARGMVTERASGHVVAKRPGRFRWISDPPFAQQLISDGETLWFYDPDLEQVTVRAVDDELLSTPALLLSGNVERVVKTFDVTLEVDAEGYLEFELTPTDQGSLFESLVFSFDTRRPTLLEIVDALGQRTRIFFTEFTPNPTVDLSSFVFEIPPGVDVIHDR